MWRWWRGVIIASRRRSHSKQNGALTPVHDACSCSSNVGRGSDARGRWLWKYVEEGKHKVQSLHRSVRRLLYHRGARGHLIKSYSEHGNQRSKQANHWKCSYFYTTRAHSFADVVVNRPGWLAGLFEFSILIHCGLVIPIILYQVNDERSIVFKFQLYCSPHFVCRLSNVNPELIT